MVKSRVFVGSITAGLLLVPAAIASAEDGLTCKATGGGTNWNLAVTGAPTPVGGYVAGFPGGSISSFAIDGFPGQPDTTGLPPGTSNGLFASIPPGRPVVIHVVTSGQPSGPFNVAFINQAQTGYGQVFPCPFEAFPNPVSTKSSDDLGVAVGDPNGDGIPDLIFGAPGPGTLFVDQAAVTRSRDSAKAKAVLVRAERIVVTKAGEVTVPLRATAAGKAELIKKGSFSARLKVVFKPSSGASKSKSLLVTFKKAS